MCIEAFILHQSQVIQLIPYLATDTHSRIYYYPTPGLMHFTSHIICYKLCLFANSIIHFIELHFDLFTILVPPGSQPLANGTCCHICISFAKAQLHMMHQPYAWTNVYDIVNDIIKL